MLDLSRLRLKDNMVIVSKTTYCVREITKYTDINGSLNHTHTQRERERERERKKERYINVF